MMLSSDLHLPPRKTLDLPKRVGEFDDMLSDYCASSSGKTLASDTVAFLQDTEPHLESDLQVTWGLV